MPSPFPGMDPYLEGYLWPDVHSALAHTIRQQLAPQIQPKYVARLEISVIEDQSPAAEIGIMYPDVEVIKTTASRPGLPETPGDIVQDAGSRRPVSLLVRRRKLCVLHRNAAGRESSVSGFRTR